MVQHYPTNSVNSSQVAEEAQEWANAAADQFVVIRSGQNKYNVSLKQTFEGKAALTKYSDRVVTVNLGAGSNRIQGASAYTEATQDVLAKPTDDPPKFAVNFTNEDTIETESRLAPVFGSTDKEVIVQALGKKRAGGNPANTEDVRSVWDFQTTNATTAAKTSASFQLINPPIDGQEATVAIASEQETAVAIAKTAMEVMSKTMGGLIYPALVSDRAAY
jgi:hypothetical protein